MVQRKIIWSHKAKLKRYEVFEFYINRNKSKAFSKKLNKKINKSLQLLVKYPKMGIKTDLDGIRALIIDRLVIFYEVEKKAIIVHHFWDSRQNPKDLKIV